MTKIRLFALLTLVLGQIPSRDLNGVGGLWASACSQKRADASRGSDAQS